jgi:hypothetical protein
MGFMDDIKGQAENALSEHGDQVGDAIDKAVDFADEKTGGKLGDKADVIADKAKDALGINDEQA